jgi:hypothetical protein
VPCRRLALRWQRLRLEAARLHCAVVPHRSPLRIVGAVSSACTAVGIVVFSVLHAGPRRGNTVRFLEDLADRPFWLLDLLGIALTGLAAVVALHIIVVTIADTRARAIGLAATLAALLGGAVLLVNACIDGPVLHDLAARWPTAAGSDRVALLTTAETFRQLDIATFTMWMLVLTGVAPVLVGCAQLLDPVWPAWAAWPAILGGLLAGATGIAQWFTGLFHTGVFVLFPVASALLAAWFGLSTLLLWRPEPAVGPI